MGGTAASLVAATVPRIFEIKVNGSMVHAPPPKRSEQRTTESRSRSHHLPCTCTADGWSLRSNVSVAYPPLVWAIFMFCSPRVLANQRFAGGPFLRGPVCLKGSPRAASGAASFTSPDPPHRPPSKPAHRSGRDERTRSSISDDDQPAIAG
jgi:hypothetical protein